MIRRPRPAARRGAIQAVELLAVLPLLLVLVLGMVEYSMILALDGQLATASREGARVAAQGGTPAEVTAAAQLGLGHGRLLQHATVVTNLVDSNGDPVAIPSGQPVSVTVQVADATTVVPDLLRFVGYSIKDKLLAGQAVMRKE